ncbi:MAG TPA: hypothetical protein VL097_03835, partial [Rhodanobacter sp.]|nr:hypothetical protein [Rhodanobacter sp.]
MAERSYVASDASLNADATGKGDGGSIAVFSRDNSVIVGGLFARGGIDGGNGGFVETSSHGALTITSTPQAGARKAGGLGGEWLIDPSNITIVANGNTGINAGNPFVSTNDGAQLGVDLIIQALTSGTSVTITTGSGSEAGDITLNADLDYNGTGTKALTLDAANNIVLNNRIFDSTPGSDVLNLSLLAGNSISLNSDITLGGGSAMLTAAAGSISQAAGKLLSGGDLTLNAATGIGAGGAIETSVDTLTFANSGAGGVALNDADDLTVSGSTGSGDVNISARTGDLTIGGDVSSVGDVALGAGAGNVVHSSGTVSGNAVHFNAWGTNGSIGASGAVLTDASQVSFEAKGSGAVQIVEANGADISGTAVNGNVAITSTTGDLVVNGDISTTGNVNLNAVAGSISRTAGGISGNALTLTAGGPNGAIGASDAIRTDVNSIAFHANGTGAVNITEANGATVSGTAGSGSVGITSTTSDLGVAAPAGIITAGGDVTLTATGGGARINIAAGAAVDTTNGAATGADVSLVADNADIFGTIDAGTSGVATIRQATAGRAIALGGDLPINLGVSDAELDNITANTIAIGDANSGAITIVGAISPALSNKLSLNSGDTITQTAGSTITVGTLSGASLGATTLGQTNQITNLGSFSAASLQIRNADPLTLLGNVTTTGAQTYDTALRLGADSVLSGTGITFNSTIDGGHTLTVDASGITTFGAAVGGTAAVGSLVTSGGGSTVLSGNVTTSGAQTYNDAVTLAGPTVLTSTAGGDITLVDTVNGAQSLAVNTAGTTRFAAAVGDATALASLTTDAPGSTALSGNVSTSGAQTYNDAVTLDDDATLTGSTVQLAATVDGAYMLSVSTSGAAIFGGAVGAATALTGLTTNSGTFSALDLTVDGSLSVTTTAGGITQTGGVYTVSGASTFDAGSDAIMLTSLNDFGGAVSLTGGTTQINDANALTLGTLQTGSLTVGSNGALDLGHGSVAGNLSATSGTSITLNGALAGLGDVAFNGSSPSGTGSIAGTGSITGIGGSPFDLVGANLGTSGGITFNGFASADATAITGAAGFDDVSKISRNMTFANATSVGGSGTIASVAGGFADNTGTSSASGIVYSGFDAVTGTGGSVTGVTGSFNLGTRVSGTSGIDYSGFNVTTLSGSGAGATIAGSGQTYTLDNTVADQGSNGGVTWTGFGNIADTSGTVAFGTGGSLSGNVTAATLNYGSYGSAVAFDLAHGVGATTGIGGTWAGVSTVTGNGNGAITGSGTFAL